MTNPIVNAFNNNFALTISLYCILLVGVVTITTLLSKLCVVLKVKAKLSDGVVAGLLLGVITSLPELVTCITSIFSTKSGAMGFGDIIGSNIFDIFVLGVCLLVCVWMFIKKKANKVNTSTLVCTGVGTVFVLLAMVASKYIPNLVWHGFNFFSIFIFLSYLASVYFIFRWSKDKPVNSKEGLTEIKQAQQSKFNKLNLGWIIILIIIVALALIACAVFLTYTSDSLVTYHWAEIFTEGGKESFGGALFLGVITSLPEIVCCINLCIHKEYNMVIDAIVGSTSFNLAILTIANICFASLSQQSGQMYDWNNANLLQIIICLIVIVLMIAYLLCNNKIFKSKLSTKQNLAINVSFLSLVVIAYIVFLIVGFIS